MSSLLSTPPSGGEPTMSAPGSRRHRRILVVEQDPVRRRALQALGRELEKEWEFHWIEKVGDVWPSLAQRPCDAVLMDWRLEDEAAASLMAQLRQRYPLVVRLLRCTPSDAELARRAVRVPVHVLLRGWDAATTRDAIWRAFLLEDWLASEPLQQLIGRMRRWPVLPTLYNQIATELRSPTGSLEFVARLISRDPVLTARVLHAVNSPVFGLAHQVTETVEAVLYLGVERVKSLVLFSGVLTQYDKATCPGFSVEQLWMHCMATGAHAMKLTVAETGEPRLGEMAFTAGLLHDVGMLLLAANVPELYGRVLKQAEVRHQPIWALEREVLGATHAELGACLLGQWDLPLPIIEAVGWHHQPGRSQTRVFSLLTAVHVGNAFDQEQKAGQAGVHVSLIDQEYLQWIGLLDRVNRWREACGCLRKISDEDPTEKARRRRESKER